jgi:hypothetical protein
MAIPKEVWLANLFRFAKVLKPVFKHYKIQHRRSKVLLYNSEPLLVFGNAAKLKSCEPIIILMSSTANSAIKKTPIIQTNVTAETMGSAAIIAANPETVITIAMAAEDTVKIAKPMTKGALYMAKQAAGPLNIPPKSAKTPINASDRTFRLITT